LHHRSSDDLERRTRQAREEANHYRRSQMGTALDPLR
jgi:hypothetical protein